MGSVAPIRLSARARAFLPARVEGIGRASYARHGNYLSPVSAAGAAAVVDVDAAREAARDVLHIESVITYDWW